MSLDNAVLNVPGELDRSLLLLFLFYSPTMSLQHLLQWFVSPRAKQTHHFLLQPLMNIIVLFIVWQNVTKIKNALQ